MPILRLVPMTHADELITKLLRPWKAKEVPVGARIQRIGDRASVAKIRRADDDCAYIDGAGDLIAVHLLTLLTEYQHQLKDDTDETWRPCGLPLDPMPEGKHLSDKAHAPWPICNICDSRRTEVGYRSILVGKEREPFPMCSLCALLYVGEPSVVPSLEEVRTRVWLAADKHTKQVMSLADPGQRVHPIH